MSKADADRRLAEILTLNSHEMTRDLYDPIRSKPNPRARRRRFGLLFTVVLIAGLVAIQVFNN